MRSSGFALIELVVALLIFATVAAGLAQCLVAAERARRTSENWMRATQLAEERLERMRAGEPADVPTAVDGFNVSSQREPAAGYAGLRQIVVRVRWIDRGEQEFVVRSLIRSRP